MNLIKPQEQVQHNGVAHIIALIADEGIAKQVGTVTLETWRFHTQDEGISMTIPKKLIPYPVTKGEVILVSMTFIKSHIAKVVLDGKAN